jgi:hypothetical protein
MCCSVSVCGTAEAIFLQDTINADHYFHVLKEQLLASSNAWMSVSNKHFFNGIWLNMTIFMTELYLINYLHGSDMTGTGQHTLHISTYVIPPYTVSLMILFTDTIYT